MDRNSITGMLLMVLLTMVYFYFFAPDPPKPPAESNVVVTDSLDNDQNPPLTDNPGTLTAVEGTNEEEADSAASTQLQDKYSEFYKLVDGEEETVTVKTEKLTVNISTKGGMIESAYLNEYQTFDSLPLPVIANHPENQFFLNFAFNNRSIRTDELFFTPSMKSLEVNGEETQILSLKAEISPEKYIEQVYTFTGNTYDVDYGINFVGIREDMGRGSFYNISWVSHLPKTELDITNMRNKSSIVYRLGDDVEKMSPSDDLTKEKLTALVKWVSFKSQFFSHILIAEEPLRSGNVTMTTPENEDYNRKMQAEFIVDIGKSQSESTNFKIYMGPNEYNVLNSYKLELQEQMDLGWWIVGWINIGTVYAFKFLEKFIGNYGLIIIVLAIAIRLLMFPLSYKSYVSMAKMRVLNNTPEMKALDAKHKDDPQKLQMAKMGIYREMGVSMFGGCLPMLLSYPFLIALFFFFPQSVELRQQSFLWAHDLSTYDSILNLPFTIPAYGDHVSLFTILMAISTFIYTLYQQQSQPATGANSQFKYIAYIMPVFLLVFLNSYASGLSLYYFMSNLIQITQTTVIRYFLDDEKLLGQMRATQKSRKKKGKGGKGAKGGDGGGKTKSRLEQWVEKQQRKQQEALKERKAQGGTNRRTRRNSK
jgi:YidC/Oxa1 family membrane protein insertase